MPDENELTLPEIISFEWDEGNLGHVKKHEVEFSECEQVFFNKPILFNKDQSHSLNEDRFQAIGKTNEGKLLFIVFTVRNNKIRIISARSQNKKERSIYEKI